MKRVAQFALWGAVAAAGIGACSDESASSGDANSNSSSGSNVTGAGNTSTGQGGTGGSNSTGSGGPAATVSVCLPSCETVADCDLGAAYFDVDNHVCDEGACVYQGCNDDSECEILGNYLCHQSAGGFSNCTLGCNTPDDCVIGNGAAYDADNYQCDNGACVYSGCKSDEECDALGSNLVCRDSGGIKYCLLACNTLSDCILGEGAHRDADNFSCNDGVCQYLGCHSDRECSALNDSVCH